MAVCAGGCGCRGQCVMIRPFPAVHTWRLFFDSIQSSLLIQPGAKRTRALSGLGPFFAFVQKGFSCGTAHCLGLLCSQTPHRGSPRCRGLRKVSFDNVLCSSPFRITVWEENDHGSRDWKGGWRWLSRTPSLFSWRKRGPGRGYGPCTGHGTACALISDPAFVLFHTSSPVKDFLGELSTSGARWHSWVVPGCLVRNTAAVNGNA